MYKIGQNTTELVKNNTKPEKKYLSGFNQY